MSFIVPKTWPINCYKTSLMSSTELGEKTVIFWLPNISKTFETAAYDQIQSVKYTMMRCY